MVTALKNFKKIEIGSIINGRIIRKKPKEVFVDLSPYGLGRVYGIFYLRSKDLIDKLNENDEVAVKIVGLDDGYGNLEVELQNTHQLTHWQKIKELMTNNTILELEVKEINRGGLIVELENIKGFVPLSQLAPENYPRINESDKKQIMEHLNKFLGTKLKLKIISIDPSTNKLILSEKATKLEEYKKVLSQFKIGDLIDVDILSISPFGLFVRVYKEPQIDGLIHITEIPDKFKNLEELFKIGQTIKAQIIKIENDRVNLSLKNLADDQWLKFINEYQEGDLIEGLVVEKNNRNIYSIIDINGIKGFLLNNLDKVEVNKNYQFKISKLEPQNRTLILELIQK
jgi:small subunit ribosomal protein S1